MSRPRRFGDIAARSVGLPDAPLLATRSLPGSQIAVALLLCGPDQCGRTREIPPEDSFLVEMHLTAVAHHETWQSGQLLVGQSYPAHGLRIVHLLQPTASVLAEPQDIVSFYIPKAALAELIGSVPPTGAVTLACEPGTIDPVMTHLVQALLPTLRDPQDESWLFVDQLALAVLAHCAVVFGDKAPRPRIRRGGLSQAQVEQAKAYLAEHAGGDVVLADVARVTGLSRGHFIRAFALSTGVTPHRWLQRHRIEKAKSLLLETNMTIAEIALCCGFSDQSHLTRSLKLLLGINPAALRRHHRPVLLRV